LEKGSSESETAAFEALTTQDDWKSGLGRLMAETTEMAKF
jgi:hypothetical protein